MVSVCLAEPAPASLMTLRERSYECSREDLPLELYKNEITKITPDQDPDEFLYMMDSSRDRLSASSPPEGPMHRQFKDILLQALSTECKRIRRAHLERRDHGLADIRRKMAANYADNLSRRSITSVGIVRPDMAMQSMNLGLSKVRHQNCLLFGHYKQELS